MARARKYRLRELQVGDDMGSIQQLADRIREQIDRSMQDPQTRVLAGAIVSGAYDWVQDPRDGQQVPAIKYHDRFYRVAAGKVPAVCRPRDYKCEVVQIWNFLVLNVRYVSDMDDADTYQDLRTTLESGMADCDDFQIAFCALLRSIGYQCAARIVSLHGNTWDHVYPIVNVPGIGWVPLDATEDGRFPGWEFPHAARRIDFDMSRGTA